MTHDNDRPNIADELMALDTHAPADRARYEQALGSLFDRRLTRADVAKLLLAGVGGLAGAVVCGLLAFTEPAGLPTRTRVALACLAAVGLTWASLAAFLFRRGSVNSATHGTAAATLGFAFSLLATAALGILSAASNRPTPAGLLLLAVIPLTLSAVVLILHHLRQTELRLRRDLLETEYRLARDRRQ